MTLAQQAAVGAVGEVVAAGTVAAVAGFVFRTLWKQSAEWERIASDRKAEIESLRRDLAAEKAQCAKEIAECRAELDALRLEMVRLREERHQ